MQYRLVPAGRRAAQCDSHHFQRGTSRFSQTAFIDEFADSQFRRLLSEHPAYSDCHLPAARPARLHLDPDRVTSAGPAHRLSPRVRYHQAELGVRLDRHPLRAHVLRHSESHLCAAATPQEARGIVRRD